MNRVSRAILIVLCFVLGALLVYLPWSRLWEQNYFLSRFPMLIPVVLHPSMRGAVSGLGLLDVALAVGMIRRRPQPASGPRE